MTLFSLTPGEVESQAVQTLGPIAKYSSFIGATAVNIVIYGLVGILVGKLYVRLHLVSYLARALLSSAVAYFLLFATTSILLAITEASAGPISIAVLTLYLIPPSLAFGFLLPGLYQNISLHWKISASNLEPTKQIPADMIKGTRVLGLEEDRKISRRMFLRSEAASAVALPVLYFGTNTLLFSSEKQGAQSIAPVLPASRTSPAPAGFENPMLSPLIQYEITPTELFYRIDNKPRSPHNKCADMEAECKGAS